MHRDALGYPEHEGRGAYDTAVYAPLSVVLTTPITFDAHFCAYSAPQVPRRLATERAFESSPEMVLFAVDVEPKGHAPVTPQWLTEENRKLDTLVAEGLNPFGYRTRGGYRLLFLLLAPFVIRTRGDAQKWRASYLNWLDVLEQGVGIVGDRSCGDWTRLYRLPFVVRDGQPQMPDVFGNAKAIGTWPVSMVEAQAVEQPDVIASSDELTTDKRNQAIKLIAAAWPPPGTRHQASFALCGALAHAHWDAEDIADFVSEISERAQPGNGDRAKRLKQAQTQVRKVAEDAPVAGWPTVCEHVDPDVVDEVTKLLELRPPEYDENFVAVWSPWIPVPPPLPIPSRIDLKAALKSTQKRLATRKDVESIKAAELLKRVINGDFLIDDVSDNRVQLLCDATLVVVRTVPLGTSVDQVVGLLMSSAGSLANELPELIARAIEYAKTLPSILAPKPRGPRGAVNGPQHITLDDQFDLDAQGQRQGRPTSGSQKNVRLAFLKLGVNLQYNEFCEQEEMVRDGRRVVIEDHHLKEVRAEMERAFDLKPPKDDLWDLSEVIARESKYHPVRDYLDSLPTDQPVTDLTETWLIRIAGAPDTPYVRAVSRLVLVAAVRRIRQPGCKFDEMMILETPEQGKFKSSALKALAVHESWFTDDLELDDDDKKMIEQTSGKWIIEAPELSGISKGDHTRMKKWLSKSSGRSRMAYGRKVREFPRQFIVIGTTNDVQYLKDARNRRYWPVRVREFDVKALVEIRDQLWAEAVRLDLENPEDEYIRLDPSLYEAAAEEQDRRRVDDPYEITLDGLFGQETGRVRVEDVWKTLGHHTENLPNKTTAQLITSAMQRIGWDKDRHSVKGHRGHYYERGTDDQKKVLIIIDGSSVTGWRLKAMLPTPQQKALLPTEAHVTN